MKTKISLLVGFFLLIVFTATSCKDDGNEPEPQTTSSIAGIWKVKTLSISGELINIGLPPDDALYSNILIVIPDTTKGNIIGNNFYNMIEFDFEIKEHQQISIRNEIQYVENELIIQLKQGVDAAEFATYYKGIAPKRLLLDELNIWLFETDGTEPLSVIINNLSQNDNVKYVHRNHAGIALRDIEGKYFLENMRNTMKFNLSNNELIFLDTLNNPIIIFTNK